MTITYTIPDSVIKHCRKELKLSDKKITMIFSKYLDWWVHNTTQTPLDGFQDWMENNYEK